jgi:hypothetical protein
LVPCRYLSKDGTFQVLDLDAVFDLVCGSSGRGPNWTATIVYVPAKRTFVELRSSPPDVRGNSTEEAEEVEPDYIRNAFGLSDAQLQTFLAAPGTWQTIEQHTRRRDT